ncbi:RimJ/RimL family protein N-acetyltransferase [Litoreibacter ponti]|uniref:RimJ/RimL family protein N-acetyltransferase n=1 Tax=Litoreibacter ponti TaxID=1510457 RepID=A0A2T6BIY2_9RHOB|nr:GNAT family N-acetyltransferase [Litoreibacter ponti]PTX56021.1 RimJ/RimL family protein N-acetyltransferase [Litoreibacter ponti]
MDIYKKAGLTGRDAFSTERLDIRPLGADDASALADGMADPQVRRFMPALPDPYGLSDAEAFIARVQTGGSRDWAVWRDGALIGGLSFNTELGFWLRREHWGQGLAFEMSHALLTRWFAQPQAWPVYSSYLRGNPASGAVQSKLGFAPHAQDETRIRTVLAPEQWHLANPWVIETDRLRIAPLEARHAAEFATLTGVEEIAKMTGSMKIGWGGDEVAAWINTRRWRGVVGFVHGIWLKETDTLIGQVGMGGTPSDIGYVISPEHWGQGYASEAARAMLDAAIPRFELSEVVASAFQDNPASQAVLTKLGFKVIAEKEVTVPARLEPTMIYKYRLSLSTEGSNP